jgi:hypothetical protein
MKKCTNCGSKMPKKYFQPAFLNGYNILDWCPVCVLTAMNLIHGMDVGDDSLLGERAKDLLEDSWQYFQPTIEDVYGFLGERKNEHPLFLPYFGVNKE